MNISSPRRYYQNEMNRVKTKIKRMEIQKKLYNKYIGKNMQNYFETFNPDQGEGKQPVSLIYKTLKKQLDGNLLNPIKVTKKGRYSDGQKLVEMGDPSKYNG